MKIFQNQHRHSMYTNARISDSTARNEDYAKRAVELNHGIITTMEHGFQGRYIEGYELSKKHDLKFVFGTEAYWVKNRLEKDSTNAHICLYAKNENGRQGLNEILSEANITGFYYQPRLDIELILSLPREDIICTSACIAFWKYGKDSQDIIMQLHNHFNNNFYLEVQYHNTKLQSDLNKDIIQLSSLYNIPLIMGCDSHFIHQENSWERDEYIKSKNINYPHEEGWFMDYPDGDMAYNRFIEQKVLSIKQIEEAMDNTNIFLNINDYNNPCFNQEIKMPTLYPELPQEKKDKKYEELIWMQWEEEKQKIDSSLHNHYESEIRKEIEAVKITKHADYFLLDYEIVKRAITKGGLITNSGRGSGVSYFTNKLLGFTKIDRIAASVKMYPERFISPTRILESKNLADLDLNTANPEIFAEAQTELLGKESSYPMLAYGTMQKKAAWKMYARAKKLDFDLANNVSEQIEKYEKALKHADDDEEKNEIDLLDYIDEQYHELIKDSERYLGIISDIKAHACGYLLYQGNIRKEIGLIKTKSKSGKEVLCTVMDGKWAEKYKFLKNDLLKVTVVEIIKKVYKKIGIEPHDERELLALCKDNDKVWDTYKYGRTVGLNQVEQIGTSARVMKYNPRNISELCAFVAAIRPGFKSMYKKFENREHFEYGIPTFDKLIQTEELPESFLLYQEMAMAALNFAGIPMSECYDVIKNISKKREKEVKKFKDVFLKGFANKIIELENREKKEANKIAKDVWKIIDDSCRYQFNASHSYCVATDSLYGAYLKSTHTLDFYEVFLNILNDKKQQDKERISNAIQEAEEGYGIKFKPLTFRQDNRKFVCNKNTNEIYGTLKAVKGLGGKVAEELYLLKDNQYNTFTDLLMDIKKTKINLSNLNTLIRIGYFKEFGNIKLLEKICEYFEFFKKGDAKEFDVDKTQEEIILNILKRKSRLSKTGKTYLDLNTIDILKEIEEWLRCSNIKDYELKERISFQEEYLGYVNLTTHKEEDRRKLLVLDIQPLKSNKDNKIWAYVLSCQSIGRGIRSRINSFEENNINIWGFDKEKQIEKENIKPYKNIHKNDILFAKRVEKNKKGYWYLLDYDIINDI